MTGATTMMVHVCLRKGGMVMIIVRRGQGCQWDLHSGQGLSAAIHKSGAASAFKDKWLAYRLDSDVVTRLFQVRLQH